VQKDFEAFIGQGEQAQGRSWRLAKERTSCVCGKKERRRRRCEEEFLVLMCGEVLMGSVYGKMKHGMELWVASYRSEASGLLV
jgi:hypothetical protein